ncbi:hypothetical protein GCM10010123_20460 [Pilimelia anulata]|uniref:Uncharacterized protein n=1 Tax=Pilimelia anulata TaxID=53371 RepID=A0A8J3BAG7_9ACTN|nr:hypothetical protein [Pilimelia anulata]GGJ90530.1 hypothetical protein GCM10010123_20460 [Pilimelia anulata]
MISYSDVGQLIALATTTLTPGASGQRAEYRRLVNKFVMDPEFREAVEGVLGGVDCDVAEANETIGLVLYPRVGCAWAWPSKAPELPWNKSEDSGERAARMLTIVALLAMQFPTGSDLEAFLDDPERIPPPVSVIQLEEYIREFCQRLADAEQDVAADTPDDERPLWSSWLGRTAFADTEERTSRVTSTYLVYTTLEGLQQLGFVSDLTPTNPAEQKTYRARRRFLAQYPEFLMDPLFEALRSRSA